MYVATKSNVAASYQPPADVLADQLPSPTSCQLLHPPDDEPLHGRLTQLVSEALLTQFPANWRQSPFNDLLSTDEAANLLRDVGSPWRRQAWWSPELVDLLEHAVRAGRAVTAHHLLAHCRHLQLPQQCIRSLGQEMTSCLSRLTTCSLACNRLTTLRGGDLPRGLVTLQLYGNKIDNLESLFSGAPPLRRLGLGAMRLNDNHVITLTRLLAPGAQPALRVLDLCDNNIVDLSKVSALIKAAPGVRALTLAGNPAFLPTGYYRRFIEEPGRIRILDGEELTKEALASMELQLWPLEQQSPDPKAGKSNNRSAGKSKPAKKSARRPEPDLLPSRLEPSFISTLVRLTGLVYLPFVPKEKYPGLEVCAVFIWITSDSGGLTDQAKAGLTQVSAPAFSETDTTADGEMRPLEATLQERGDVTVLETPLEWVVTDLTSLRDALLAGIEVHLVRREKWTPKKTKQPRTKNAKNTTKKNKDSGSVNSGVQKAMAGNEPPAAVEENAGPPSEYSLGSLRLGLRALLRPAPPLLLQGEAGSTASWALPTTTHWTSAVQIIQDEKKEKKASAKKEAKADKDKDKDKKLKLGSGRKKKMSTVEPGIQCYFAVELYKKPNLEEKYMSKNDMGSFMPIEDV